MENASFWIRKGRRSNKLALFGGALAVAGLVAASVLRKSNSAADHEHEQHQQTSNAASTTPETQDGSKDEGSDECMLHADETQSYHNNRGSMEASSFPNSTEGERAVIVEVMEREGRAAPRQLTAGAEIPARYDKDEEGGEEAAMEKDSQPSRLERNLSPENLEEEAEAFDPEKECPDTIPVEADISEEERTREMQQVMVKKGESSVEEKIRTEPKESDAEKNGTQNELGKSIEKNEGKEDDDKGVSSTGKDAETENDELELSWEGTETCSSVSNAEAVWPAESMESLAAAMDDRTTHLKKPAIEVINNHLNNYSSSSSSKRKIMKSKRTATRRQQKALCCWRSQAHPMS